MRRAIIKNMPADECEPPLLCWPGTGLASHETAISGSFQQNLAGLCNSVCQGQEVGVSGWGSRARGGYRGLSG
jgi:predicted benzoate:H+ symporter BenE